MANPAAEARAAAQVRWPGAVVVARHRNSLTHMHPDDYVAGMAIDTPGARIIEDGIIGPMHYGATADQEIDTAWQSSSGAWQYEMLRADYNAHARDILNVGDIINYADPISGENVTFQPLALNWVDNITNSRQQLALPQAVMAQVEGDKLIWQNGYGTGRHWVWQTNPGSLVKVLTIDDISSLPAPTVANPYLEVEFVVKYSTGLTILIDGTVWNKRDRITTATSIEFRQTSTDKILWFFRAPKAWDSGNPILSTSSGLMQVERRGNTQYVTVRWPKAWIDGAIFPINLDVTVDATVAASADDSVEDGSDGYPSELLIDLNSASRWGGTRWALSIAQGVTVGVNTYASVRTGGTGTDNPNVNIYAQNVDTAAAFTSAGTNIQDRTRTTAYTLWSASGVGTSQYVNTPSLSDEIQEVLDRVGWASGNYLALIWDCIGNNLTFSQYDNGPGTYPPKIHIEYTAGGGVSGSASLSPSASASPSVSPSISPSYSLSPSASASPSKSPSASLSPSASVSPSISPSASVSPSLSPSASVSPSLSPSVSVSPSLSPSASVSPSVSPSASPSVSPSVSPSISLSASVSPSLSPSASVSLSISPSASAAPPIEGSTCWGHITGVIETNVRTFASNWTGTGTIENAGDAERLALEATEYMISEVVYTTARMVELDQNHYDPSGDNVNLDYRHGATQGECEAAAWNDYTVPFNSLGYVQVRVTSTL